MAKKKTGSKSKSKAPRTAKQKAATKRMIAANRASKGGSTRSSSRAKGNASLAKLQQEVGGLKGRMTSAEKLLKNHSAVISDLTAAVEEHDRVLVTHSQFLQGATGARKGARGPMKTVQMPAVH